MWEMAEILITGGAGNLGRKLALTLQEKGHGLHIMDLPACDFSFCNGWDNTRVFQGDILDPDSIGEALAGVDVIYHLAAILPPESEVDKKRTFQVNVDGTRNLLEACTLSGKTPRIVFASSVSVYGDTSQSSELIDVNHPVNPNDLYAMSKVEGERILMESGLPYVNLRISAIAIPEFLDPPEPWPFTGEQRIELVVLADLVEAMASLVENESASGRTLIIAGGATWQIHGETYVRRWGDIMEIPLEEMSFQVSTGWLNWYDTAESQKLLNYQKTSLELFSQQLKEAVDEALA
jgi:UDP-glucose 4-epimerase